MAAPAAGGRADPPSRAPSSASSTSSSSRRAAALPRGGGRGGEGGGAGTRGRADQPRSLPPSLPRNGGGGVVASFCGRARAGDPLASARAFLRDERRPGGGWKVDNGPRGRARREDCSPGRRARADTEGASARARLGKTPLPQRRRRQISHSARTPADWHRRARGGLSARAQGRLQPAKPSKGGRGPQGARTALRVPGDRSPPPLPTPRRLQEKASSERHGRARKGGDLGLHPARAGPH